MSKLRPDFIFENVTKIDPKIFEDKKLIIFDIDNTLFYPESTRIKKETIRWFRELKKEHKCICFSNSNTIEERANGIKEMLSCDLHLSQHKKPSKKLFKEIKRIYKVRKAKDIVVIGDAHLTDILFANRNGATSVLVKPFAPEPLLSVRIGRRIENLTVKIFK
tara:strand:+ start:754 stop:1242 length:489 start_codon:yes stop_codon:yes gene_type:complete